MPRGNNRLVSGENKRVFNKRSENTRSLESDLDVRDRHAGSNSINAAERTRYSRRDIFRLNDLYERGSL